MEHHGDWVSVCAFYGLVIDWRMYTVKCPGVTRYWTWDNGECETVMEAVLEAHEYLKDRK